MTDCFALLGQPRRPWLELDELKQAFHAKSLQAHPDAQAHPATDAQSQDAFTELNEAYQVLREPKRRLHHLLTLEGNPPAKSAPVPEEVAQLFPLVARVTQETQAFMEKWTATTNALSRSLLTGDLVAAKENSSAILKKLRELETDALNDLRKLSGSWKSGDAKSAGELHSLYLLFSYLMRWAAELEEKRAQLAAI